MALKGKNLLQQVQEDASKHELLNLKEGIQRIYLVTTGIFQRPNAPHTSIVIARSLGEVNQIYLNTITADMEGIRKIFWPSVDKEDRYPQVKVVEKEIKPQEIFNGLGNLDIRPGYFNPAFVEPCPVLSYDSSNQSDGNVWQYRIIVRVESGKRGALNRLIEEGKTINDVLLGISKQGYVSDIYPPFCSAAQRK